MMRQHSHLILVWCMLAVLTGLGVRPDDGTPVHNGQSVSLAPTESVRAAAASEATSIDSAFVPADQAYEVKLPTVMRLFMTAKKRNIHFIDARDPKLYVAGHIPGAVNIPFEKLAEYTEALQESPKSDLQVLYCDGGDCHLSHDLAEHMLSQGWNRIAVYTGGWAEWSKETDVVATTP